ncbi:protein MceE, partial [Klebsiella pneumoniae]
QDIADTECNQHIMQIDSAQDKREYGDDNYICGCGCESCCGCGHDL